jgi:hypothetical protein
MTDELSSLCRRAEAWAAAEADRAKRIERREAFLDLVPFGYSYRPIATATRVSLAAARREVDKALAERPLHAPERHGSKPGGGARRCAGVRLHARKDAKLRFSVTPGEGERAAKLLRKPLKILDSERK